MNISLRWAGKEKYSEKTHNNTNYTVITVSIDC